ncbi:hypothetical protein KIPB_005093, partial [Kipferlia bialata]
LSHLFPVSYTDIEVYCDLYEYNTVSGGLRRQERVSGDDYSIELSAAVGEYSADESYSKVVISGATPTTSTDGADYTIYAGTTSSVYLALLDEYGISILADTSASEDTLVTGTLDVTLDSRETSQVGSRVTDMIDTDGISYNIATALVSEASFETDTVRISHEVRFDGYSMLTYEGTNTFMTGTEGYLVLPFELNVAGEYTATLSLPVSESETSLGPSSYSFSVSVQPGITISTVELGGDPDPVVGGATLPVLNSESSSVTVSGTTTYAPSVPSWVSSTATEFLTLSAAMPYGIVLSGYDTDMNITPNDYSGVSAPSLTVANALSTSASMLDYAIDEAGRIRATVASYLPYCSESAPLTLALDVSSASEVYVCVPFTLYPLSAADMLSTATQEGYTSWYRPDTWSAGVYTGGTVHSPGSSISDSITPVYGETHGLTPLEMGVASTLSDTVLAHLTLSTDTTVDADGVSLRYYRVDTTTLEIEYYELPLPVSTLSSDLDTLSVIDVACTDAGVDFSHGTDTGSDSDTYTGYPLRCIEQLLDSVHWANGGTIWHSLEISVWLAPSATESLEYRPVLDSDPTSTETSLQYASIGLAPYSATEVLYTQLYYTVDTLPDTVSLLDLATAFVDLGVSDADGNIHSYDATGVSGTIYQYMDIETISPLTLSLSDTCTGSDLDSEYYVSVDILTGGGTFNLECVTLSGVFTGLVPISVTLRGPSASRTLLSVYYTPVLSPVLLDAATGVLIESESTTATEESTVSTDVTYGSLHEFSFDTVLTEDQADVFIAGGIPYTHSLFSSEPVIPYQTFDPPTLAPIGLNITIGTQEFCTSSYPSDAVESDRQSIVESALLSSVDTSGDGESDTRDTTFSLTGVSATHGTVTLLSSEVTYTVDSSLPYTCGYYGGTVEYSLPYSPILDKGISGDEVVVELEYNSDTVYRLIMPISIQTVYADAQWWTYTKRVVVWTIIVFILVTACVTGLVLRVRSVAERRRRQRERELKLEARERALRVGREGTMGDAREMAVIVEGIRTSTHFRRSVSMRSHSVAHSHTPVVYASPVILPNSTFDDEGRGYR